MNQILDILNNSGYVFYFLVVDNFLDIDLPRLSNFHLIYAYKKAVPVYPDPQNSPYFCLEETGIRLDTKNTGQLLSQPQVLDYIHRTSAGQKVAIIPFKPSSKLDNLCSRYGWTLIANSGPTNRLLEDKIKFVQICQAHDLPVIPYKIDTFNLTNFEKYQQLLGSNLVVQTHFGWAGNSTFSFSSWSDAKNRIPANTLVKYSSLISGYSLLNNCCLTRHGLIQSPPALQYTGIPQLTPNPFATVGRQWPCLAPVFIQNKVREITKKFIPVLKHYQFKGFFGLDFLVSGDNVFLLECNPRLTASFAFYTKIELANNVIPLFYFHLLEFINAQYSIDIKKENNRFSNTNLVGSEITLKNNKSQTIKKINSFDIYSLSSDPVKIKNEIIQQILS